MVGAPPRRPIASPRARRGNKHYWTIHTNENHVFTAKTSEHVQTAVIGFKNPDDAIIIGKMLETYYMMEKEWPKMTGAFHLPEAPEGMELYHLFFRKWDTADLEVTCTKNFLNMIVIDDIGTTKRGINFNGKMYSFEAPHDFYVNRLDELYFTE